jgi:AcrR family transcriptional regulator
MARKRSLDEGPVLRGQILQHASLLFYERGFAGTSIRDIGEAVGISSSTMYHHFPNKQAVLHAIVVDFMRDFVAATVPVLRDTSVDVRERLARVVRLHLVMSDERRPELLVGNPIRNALEPQQRTEGIALQRQYQDAMLALVEEGVSGGTFTVHDPVLAAMAVLDMLNGVREWFNPSGKLSRDDLVEGYVALVGQTLGVNL